MFYKFDKTSLVYTRDKKRILIWFSSIVLAVISSFLLGRYTNPEIISQLEDRVVLINSTPDEEEFSREILVSEIRRLNIKFPHIVMAQSIIETGHWGSEVFLQNHNLFGMKEARTRINTAQGTSLNHAFYENWKESLYDYAFYQSRYLNGKVSTEEAYFHYLSQSYAESPDYVNALKKIIERENLKSEFE